MSYQATGKITDMANTRQVSDKFQVRDFVIEVPGGKDGQYPQLYRMQFVQDGCSNLDGHSVGDEVTVDFDIRGRRSEQGKVFTSLQAWRIASAQAKPQQSQQGAPPVPQDFEENIPFEPLRGLL